MAYPIICEDNYPHIHTIADVDVDFEQQGLIARAAVAVAVVGYLSRPFTA